MGCSRRKYPNGNVYFDAGETSGVIQTVRSVDGTTGARLHSHGGAGGNVQVSDRRAGGAHVPAEIRRRGGVQLVGGPASEGFGGSECWSEVEGLQAELNEGAASR